MKAMLLVLFFIIIFFWGFNSLDGSKPDLTTTYIAPISLLSLLIIILTMP